MIRAALLLTFLLGGCRIERYDATRDSATESLRVAGPPVVEGDSTRVDANGPVADSTPAPVVPPAAPSGLVLPVEGVRPEDLVDTYSQARGENRRHDAIDILAPRGTPVFAATAGRILRLFTSDKGGLTIYQLGEDGRTVYYYAHLDAYAPGLVQDQVVARGQVLGTVGDSGNAVPGNTHLHFALWTVEDPENFWDGEPLNPYPLLGGR